MTAVDPPSSMSATYVGDEALPPDVGRFRIVRDRCDHLRGEVASDRSRARQIEKGMEASCTGTDAALTTLRRRHANDPVVVKALAAYEEDIE